ncbi:MAG: hypothetical protein UY40_C0004G0060 [candidate division CPR1 bacterium GW2011_GWC1_49_13]|uniref:Uncharacterized protein n=1 Tax=candidate division CPR1 bacterium GW2011_GWC1_49_13 TaxID=1618342 RepID=A0A0G1VHZ0_9BACT|nr:MAG: hypothetical protein UY40_C0004G0060 [candidate division CPR1 bacterium GW2011_GWC1_49_13]
MPVPKWVVENYRSFSDEDLLESTFIELDIDSIGYGHIKAVLQERQRFHRTHRRRKILRRIEKKISRKLKAGWGKKV